MRADKQPGDEHSRKRSEQGEMPRLNPAGKIRYDRAKGALLESEQEALTSPASVTNEPPDETIH